MLCLPHTQGYANANANAAPLFLFCCHLHPPISSIRYRVSRFIKFKFDLALDETPQPHVPKAHRSISFREQDHNEDQFDRFLMFEAAVKLFNQGGYYACHDLLESLWFQSHDPLRTLFHALLQCAVAFYHLFNQNHKGAMMEMGEGLCKLRKLDIKGGPFYQFEQEISTVLNFIYQTQLELAACNEDFCLTMAQTERSYQLLEGFGAGQHLYHIEQIDGGHENGVITYIVFDPQTSYGATNLPIKRVKLPILEATRNHLIACENY